MSLSIDWNVYVRHLLCRAILHEQLNMNLCQGCYIFRTFGGSNIWPLIVTLTLSQNGGSIPYAHCLSELNIRDLLHVNGSQVGGPRSTNTFI